MKKLLVSGLLNTETSVKVRKFPIEYQPIDYPFFGVNTSPSGVAMNIALAQKTLGDDVVLLSLIGKDYAGKYIKDTLLEHDINTTYVLDSLKETPSSVVLYDEGGKRQIYCDLKDI